MRANAAASSVGASTDESAAGQATGSAIGIDLVDIQRFAEVLERRPQVRKRLFTEGELAYANAARSPNARLAARFAAKEAVMKALGIGLGACGFTEIEVIRHDSGRPELLLHGQAATRSALAGLSRWQVSLSHTDTVATAMVIAH